jgi:Flp pilus assembly protein TadG
MWRLAKRIESARSGERGAAGVTVAVMLLVLIGAGAMAVDVGQIYSERAQLQNAADAGAIAVARSCQAGSCDSELADALANSNSNDGASNAAVDLSAEGKVTVSTSTKNGSSSFLTNLFATAFDANPVQVGAKATAAWGGPGYGPSALPLTFAPCQFDVGGSVHTIKIHGTETCVSDNPSGASVAGGFEWLVPNSGVCETTVYPDDPSTSAVKDPYAESKTGLSMPSACKPVIESLLNTVVLFPVYSSVVKTGANAKYYIKGYAAFTLTGYRFPGMSGGDTTELGGSDNGIRGKFVNWVADPTTYSGSGYTAGGVSLPAHLIN